MESLNWSNWFVWPQSNWSNQLIEQVKMVHNLVQGPQAVNWSKWLVLVTVWLGF
jgi:hypothetical protein